MIKNRFYILICLLFSLSVISCSEENDLDDTPTIGTEKNGVYLGTLTYGSDAMQTVPQKLSVKKSKDEHVDLSMNHLPWKGQANLSVVLEDVMASLEEYGGTVFLSTQQVFQQKDGEEVSLEFSVTLKGTIQGDQVDLEADLDFIQPALGSQKAKFTGNKITEELSSDARITAFGIDSEAIIAEGSRLYEDTHEIKLAIQKDITEEQLKNLVPAIEISEGATISPSLGEPQDFSKPVKYHVTSEDGVVSNEYLVSLFERPEVFSFNEWELKNVEGPEECQFTLPKGNGSFSWASTDGLFANLMDNPEQPESEIQPAKPADHFGIEASQEVTEGKYSAKIETLQMRPSEVYGVPAVTGSMLYTGTFVRSFKNQADSMRLGYPIHYQPLAITGQYKYKRGERYLSCEDISKPTEVVELHDKDECLIWAVLYEAGRSDDEMLSLKDLFFTDSSKIVAEALLKSSENQLEYTPFECPLIFKEGKEFNYRKEYRIALLFSSSASGYRYSGAPGSTLWIDQVKIITE